VCRWWRLFLERPLFFCVFLEWGKKGGGVEDDDDVLIVWVLVRDRVL